MRMKNWMTMRTFGAGIGALWFLALGCDASQEAPVESVSVISRAQTLPACSSTCSASGSCNAGCSVSDSQGAVATTCSVYMSGLCGGNDQIDPNAGTGDRPPPPSGGGASPAPPFFCSGAGPYQVVVWHDADFRGRCVVYDARFVGPNFFNYADYPAPWIEQAGTMWFPNDQVSAIHVGSRVTLEVFDDRDFGRGLAKYAPGQGLRYVGDAVNDKISSFIIRPTDMLPPQVSTGARFRLVAQHSDQCLEVLHNNGNGDSVVQEVCGDNSNQLWRLNPVRDDLVQITASEGNRCLDVLGVSPHNGAPVVQWDCLGGAQTNQLWQLVRKDDNVVTIRPAHSQKCLDVSGVAQHSGASVVQWDCLGPNQLNQHWRLVPYDQDLQVIAGHSGQCLDVAGAGTGNGTNVIQWQCLGPHARQQLWDFSAMGGSRFNVTANHSGRCLDVAGAGPGNGADVFQWDCLGPTQTNQVWRLVHARSDLFQLVAGHSGRCLDVAGVGTGSGTDVVQWDCLGPQQNNQLFRLVTTRWRR
jgi:Ricin-type beta-trefoil lectin domain/Ricin-type beta-trefoil lectin domain-like